MLSHKTSPNKFKRIKIIQIMLSNHDGMNLEINNRRKFGKFLNVETDTILSNLQIKEKNDKRK